MTWHPHCWCLGVVGGLLDVCFDSYPAPALTAVEMHGLCCKAKWGELIPLRTLYNAHDMPDRVVDGIKDVVHGLQETHADHTLDCHWGWWSDHRKCDPTAMKKSCACQPGRSGPMCKCLDNQRYNSKKEMCENGGCFLLLCLVVYSVCTNKEGSSDSMR
jgi:hypothetical protein